MSRARKQEGGWTRPAIRGLGFGCDRPRHQLPANFCDELVCREDMNRSCLPLVNRYQSVTWLRFVNGSNEAKSGLRTSKCHRTGPYVVPQRPTVPLEFASDWIQSPVDYFVWQRLHEEGSDLSRRPTSPAKLVRRLFLDLIGIPPTPLEVEASEAEPTQAHYAKLVDELLSRPQFGERWAQTLAQLGAARRLARLSTR